MWRRLIVLTVMVVAVSGCERLFGPDLSAIKPLGEAQVAAFKQMSKEDREAYLAFVEQDGVTLHPDGFAYAFLVTSDDTKRAYDMTSRNLTSHTIELVGEGVILNSEEKNGPFPTPDVSVLGPVWATVVPQMREQERVRVAVPPWVEKRGPGGSEAPSDRLYFTEITMYTITDF